MKTISASLLQFYNIGEEGFLFLLDMGYRITGDHPLLYAMVCLEYVDYVVVNESSGVISNFKTKNWLQDKQYRLSELPSTRSSK